MIYRSSKHEIIGVTAVELYFARDIRLLLDLLRKGPPRLNEEDSKLVNDYVSKLREKLEMIHSYARERMRIKSSQVKN